MTFGKVSFKNTYNVIHLYTGHLFMNSIYHEGFSIKSIFLSIRWIILLLLLLLVYASVTRGEAPFFSIALSKFNNEKDAEKEETKLKNSGHDAFYRKEKNSEYQVYIEKYNTRDEAENEAMVLKDLELISDYTIREIKETPQTDKKQNTPAKENDIDVLPIPQPAKVKKKILNPGPKTKQQTTASENAPVINEPKDESSAATNKTDMKTESPPEVKKADPGIDHSSVENKTNSDVESHPQADTTTQKPVE